MAKAGQVPDINLKTTKIGEFDVFFETAKHPLSQTVSWNNDLEGMVRGFRKLGQKLRKESKKDAPEPIGKVEIQIDDSGAIVLNVVKDGAPVKKLDKVNNEYLKIVQVKVKKVNGRLKTLVKKEGFADAKFAVKKGVVELLCDEATLKAHEEQDYVIDMRRSLLKLNDRADFLDEQLEGPITLAEAASGLLNSLRNYLKEKGEELKVTVEDGAPSFEGIPENAEDFLPKLVAEGWNLLKSLVEYVKKLIEEIPALTEKIEGLVEEAQEFPGKAKEAATSAGLGGTEIIKAVKAVSNNIKEMGSGPSILKQLAETAKDTGLQIGDAATGNKGGDKAE